MAESNGNASITTSNKLRDMALEQNTSVDELIRSAISEGGSITGAARVLTVNRNTIRHHMKRMGIRVITGFSAKIEAVAQ